MFNTIHRVSRASLIAVGALISLSFTAKAEITFPSSTFENLDYGLYWFDYTKAEKAIPGQANPYYDPNKNTVLYIHGWQNGSVDANRRETLDRRNSGGPAMDLSQFWLDRGYNVGILYWNQFADESEVKDAESKIYSATARQGMRWKSSVSGYQAGPNQSVTQLLTQSVLDNMQGYNGSELRIAGHSLGNQLALNIAYELRFNANANLRADRVVLLDPFSSNWGKDYLGGKWTGEVSREYAFELKALGVAIESYRSSPTSGTPFVGDANMAMMNELAFSELKPWNFDFWQLAEKHGAAVTWYFWSKNFSTLDIANEALDAPSAASSTSQIRVLMDKNWSSNQDLGAYTESPADDTFTKKSR
ncbi:hypothetical protein KIH87_18580 [Paraneptunicella aestuarii]|uniref:hypothetical protein n=1 Tax=Paraneptunicella aestuarii TaxID=2831148 RepID=UPI001E39360E|nr:hypothetical protein [Paraneptunicella aestuarii]UAA38640.1 hypothetical protein KIH87_18580 [Paraneptunicella aestuarii]